ncbi:MAG: TonB-dependent receptor, partial [Desulfamplus sp.]|nr:TonB-dependent receptor [Desulfamplus sp.]
RPEFKELSTFEFQGLTGDPFVRGSQNIETATINHFDFRWEYYFGDGSDSFSLGYFRKNIDKPIELFSTSSGDTDRRTFGNSEDAFVSGYEIDIRLGFSFLKESWKDYYFASNAAFIQSEVGDLVPSSLQSSSSVVSVTNKNHALTGQAPVVVNINIGYDNPESKRHYALLLNYVGERIVSLGANPAPDIIQEPYTQLDAVYGQEMGKRYSLKIKAQNLLNQEVDQTFGGQPYLSYKKGVTVSVGVGAKL